ncbi:Upc2 protein [Colletotrichum limetticola]|uniref:Upc2 protein n=1 Tax=Colletotrichum limetticola TaxID=1209924 RepID=A0ABQ9PC56_9PEZI|nr:Upc2 protein [Colletotrichum limetticola]
MPKHRKSRLGCKECKERKVKCDESRPICIRCKTAGRNCSYRELVSSLPTPPAQTPAHLSTLQALSPQSSVSSSRQLQLPSAVPDPHGATTSLHISELSDDFFSERFSLFHFDLLLFFRGALTDFLVSLQSEMGPMMRLTYSEALKAPYLMDQVLAFTAAYRSTVANDEETTALYLTQATGLQTRAIGHLDIGGLQVNEDNVMALFCFSLLLGQQTLFEAFAAATSIPTVLDKLVQCLTLHHGIRGIVAEAMGKFHGHMQKVLPHNPAYSMENGTQVLHGNECDSLLQRLNENEMNEQTRGVYIDVVKILQYLFDSVRSDESRRLIVIQEWPVRVSREYIRLLQQRRPEALVLLSYYAVLLHWAKDYWAVCGSGEFLIRATSDHLGTYWKEWLEWPNEMLKEGKRMYIA